MIKLRIFDFFNLCTKNCYITTIKHLLAYKDNIY